jgi:hypothetical protein
MKVKVLPLWALSLAVLAGCMNSINNQVPAGNFSETSVTAGVEQMVERSRLEANLGVMAGKAPLLNNTFIPERGSIEGRNLTRTFLKNTLETLGYKVDTQNYRKNGINIIVKLLAEQPTDEYILLGAHLDSVKNAGADDNGSGSVAVLEAARLLPKLEGRKVNIIFAWFDEEELGLVGSEAMAAEFKKQGLKITSVHTIDMIGWDKDEDRVIEIERPDGILWDYYKMVNETHQLKIPLSRTNSGDTDHVAFRSAGFLSVGLCEEWVGGDTTPYYHKKTDTYETVNFGLVESGTKLVIAAVGDLSQKVPAPANIKLVPHNRYPGRERHFEK